MTLTVGSLFSGIGGIDLGLERAGMTVRWQCESEPFCRAVLAKHWPDVPCHPDVKELPDDLEPVDLICGGYPCQPFSVAGRRGGTDDARHLWPYFADTLRRLRPEWALLENVPGHLSLGFGDVLADLAALGYDTDWDCIPAAAVGAPHLRYRLFVVAHTHSEGQPGCAVNALTRPGIVVSDAQRDQLRHEPVSKRGSGGSAEPGDDGPSWVVAHAGRTGRTGPLDAERRGSSTPLPRQGHPMSGGRGEPEWGSWWDVEPDVGRVAHGVPRRMERLRALGNAVVPQVAEYIGRRIVGAAL